MTKETDRIEQQDTLKKILTTEVKYLIAVAGFILGVVAPYYDIKQDVALIKENHYTHIENIQAQIKELKEEDTELRKQYIELLKIISNK
jgi:hypothetical protein